MSNKDIKIEAERIAKKLIELGESDKSLDKVFHTFLRKEFKDIDMDVLLHVSEELINNKYIIESVKPFKLKKI